MNSQILIVFLSLVIGAAAHAQTVEEMYYDLPSGLIGQLKQPDEPEEKSRKFRAEVIKIIDNENGYIETTGGTQFAKFIRKDSLSILLIARGSYPEDGTGPLVRVLQKNKKIGWKDVTTLYLPEIPLLVVDAFDRKKCHSKSPLSASASGKYRYLLPRNGKKIRAVVDSDRPWNCNADLFYLTFNGTEFEFDY